ncbi:MAG: GntR family transcriptional regulator / MocR family aminotransferase [Eubacteriaceae bacterium]|nr:GntR family transcriptional regulator / MocR family aminotransferase [Eubacteriaceae bacterium]MDK2936530.1 GntR family transcriptional regulator / MocR family aminotransferase [Eubacteriaceae bacterium]
MLTITFKNQNKHLYEEIYEQIKAQIIGNILKSGEKLPSKRKLSQQLSVSVNTVDSAYGQLVAEGYLEAVPKSGYFVCEIEPYFKRPDEDPGSRITRLEQKMMVDIDFSPNAVDEKLFPYEVFRKEFKTIFTEEEKDLLKLPPAQGSSELREALVDLLYRSRGVKCRSDQIIIGTGTDRMLETLGLIWGKEKLVILENPVYLKAYHIFKQIGNPVNSVDIDGKGIQIEPLKKFKDAAVYVTPSHQFPLGISMPIDRRIKLLNLANHQQSMYIIEDDYDSEFRYNERPLPSLKSIDENDRVIYMGTFSKSVAPSFRISYMVLPEDLKNRYLEIYEGIGSSVSTLEQKLLARFIASGQYEKHLNRMRKIYKEKHDFLNEALKKYQKKIKISGEKAGHHLLVSLKNGLDEDQMIKKALQQGVRVYPASSYFLTGIPDTFRATVILGFGSLSEEAISLGIKRLKIAWDL